MIQAKGLKRAFGNFVAVRNVSFDIEPARGVVGLLGPNGAGKTTTMRLLTGYLRPAATIAHGTFRAIGGWCTGRIGLMREFPFA